MTLDDSGRIVAPPQTVPEPSFHFRLECCACKAVLEVGSPGAPTSHAYCPRCLAAELAAL